jgi:hypothetical protein
MVVVSVLELAPIVEEPDEDVPLWAVDDWLVVLLELLPAVSVDGVVEPLLLVEPPEAVLGVAVEPVAAPAEDGEVLEVVPPAPAAGELPVVPEPLVPEPDWAHARPKVPAMAAAMTVMLSVR